MLNPTPILILMAALLALPFTSIGAMTGPDSGVSANWLPGSTAPVGSVNNPFIKAALNGTSTGSLPGSQGVGITVSQTGTFDLTATVTAVDPANSRVALNGFWVKKAWIDKIAAMNISGLQNVETAYGNLGVDDRIRLKGTVTGGTVSVTSLEVIHARILRSELQTRLEALLRQLRDLLARQSGTSTNATSTTPSP